MSQALKVPVSIAIDPNQLARLDQVAADLDRSRSWVVGQAIERVLSPFPPSLPQCQPLAAADGSPPTGRGILAGSVDRQGSPPVPAVAHHLNGDGGGRADLGGHFVAAMESQSAHDAEVAERQRQTQERVAQQNREYLANMGKV